jgi:hypothetical protein
MLDTFFNNVRKLLGWEDDLSKWANIPEEEVEDDVAFDLESNVDLFQDTGDDLNIEQPTHLSFKFKPRRRRMHSMKKK